MDNTPVLPGALADLAGRLAHAEARIAELEAELEAARTDPTYGVWTRREIERRSAEREGAWDTAIFLDVDDMSGLNARLGYQEVDWRIFEALRLGGAMVGRWYSGDEIVILCRRADAVGLLHRVWTALAERGITATWCLVGRGVNLSASVQYAGALVQEAKAEGWRGTIIAAEQHAAWTRFHHDNLIDGEQGPRLWDALRKRLPYLAIPAN